MLYGELERKPLALIIQQRIMGFWARIISGKQTKLSSLLYQLMLNDSLLHNYYYKWMEHVEDIFNNLGMTNIWMSPSFCSVCSLLKLVKLWLNDKFLQQWNSEKFSSSRGNIYCIFKENLCLEKYLIILLTQKSCIKLLKFRTYNQYLPIETGRWNNTLIEYRTCTFCNNDIGDEFHYLFMCTSFANSRKSLLKSYYYIRLNMFKFKQFMTINKISALKKPCKLIREIIDKCRKP